MKIGAEGPRGAEANRSRMPPPWVLRWLSRIPIRVRYQVLHYWIHSRRPPERAASSIRLRLSRLDAARDCLPSDVDLPKVAAETISEDTTRYAFALSTFLERGNLMPRSFLTVSGAEEARALRARGPVLFATSHYDAYTGLLAVLSDWGPLHVLVHRDARGLHQLMRLGARILPRARQLQFIRVPGWRALLDCRGVLRRRGALATAVDSNVATLASGNPIPFLGANLHFVPGLTRLCESEGASIVFCHISRSGAGPARHRFHVSFESMSTARVKQCGEELLREYIARLEETIRAAPERWALWQFRPGEER